jgi:transcriptional regulator with XRE-family HTH domain
MINNRIGPFLKQVRLARKIKQQSIATTMSAASLSRFEAGTIDLTASRLDEVVEAIGVTFDDLSNFDIVDTGLHDDWPLIVDAAWDESVAQRILDEYAAMRAKDGANPFIELVIAVLSELIYVHANDAQRFRPEVLAQMDEYFLPLTEMTRIDGILIIISEDYLGSDRIMSWVEPKYRFVCAYSEQVSLAQKAQLASIICSIGEQAILDGNFQLSDTALDQAETVTAMVPETVTMRYNLRVLVAARDAVKMPSAATRHRLAQVVGTARVLFPAGTFEYLKEYTVEKGWARAEDYE